jgi:bleomycin hydrolase
MTKSRSINIFDNDISLTPKDIASFTHEFEKTSSKKLIQNIVTQRDVNELALDQEIVAKANHTFSTVLDDWKVTNQARSGRCWMFAGLNLLRSDTRKTLNVKDFEFSQSYLMFWDKLERANFILESIIDTVDRPVDDRTIAWILARGIEDGGQWDMFVDLVNKYGVVPKSIMPETESSANSSRMNNLLNYQIRAAAKKMRDLYQKAGGEQLREIKRTTLGVIHRMLCIHLGTPPISFDWQWKDQNGIFHRDGELSPLEFTHRYISTPMNEFVCLVHDPRPANPTGRTYAIEFLGNVLGGKGVKYLNVDIGLMKELAVRLLEEGTPVWFGCDTGKQMHRDKGIWDADLFDYSGIYDAEFSLDKIARLEYHLTRMTHAMLFTGVDTVQGKPRKWRVENSWDDKVGDKGFFLMNDSWFDEYMFEIAVPKSYLPEGLASAFDADPVILPPWDPMGSLAG